MSFPLRHIAIVCNPFHPKAFSIAEDVLKLLINKKISHQVFIKKWPEQWIGFSEVWIVGGDGTLNYFINKYADIPIPIAIFSGGTGNDFHWMLYGTITIEEQVEKVLHGSIKKVDAGKCNDRYFLNNFGTGFDAKVVKDLIGKKKKSGKASYFSSILKNVFFFKEFNCCVSCLEQKASKHFFMIGVANGKRTGGGFYLAPNAQLDDGLFDINLIGKIHPINRLRYLPVIEKGKHTGLSFVQHFQTNTIDIVSAVPLHAHVDGEYFTGHHFAITCLPGKFIFLV